MVRTRGSGRREEHNENCSNEILVSVSAAQMRLVEALGCGMLEGRGMRYEEVRKAKGGARTLAH